jgi:hypothetical protein
MLYIGYIVNMSVNWVLTILHGLIIENMAMERNKNVVSVLLNLVEICNA